MSMKTIEIRGRKVALFDEGKGEPLVYLHGFADVHAVADGLLPFHDAIGKGRRLVAPAHPGVNGSDELTDGYAISDVVFHYLEVLDALGLAKCDLVGHCVGGWIAAELAVLVPERVSRLALIGASGLFVPGEPIGDVFMHAQPERGVDYKTLRRMLFAASDTEAALRYFPDGRGDIEEEVRRYQMLRFASFVGFRPPYFYDRPLAGRLGRARMPAVVVHGEKDTFVPAAHAEAYAKGLPGAKGKVAVIKGAGHSAPMERPKETAKAVLE